MAERVVAREGLYRTAPFTLERGAENDDGDGLTLTGHAAVFGEPTVIDSWEGRFTEQIAPGAFKKTFSERTPVLQFDHGKHPLVGSLPIGKIRDAHEDEVGAFVDARLHDNWLVQPVRDAIAERSITGMSFRFSIIREEWRDEQGDVITDDDVLLRALWDDSEWPARTLRELRVPELGPVVFPAYEATDVGIRSGRTVIDLGALRRDPAERRTLARALWFAENPPEALDSDDVPADHASHPSEEPDERDAPPGSGHPSTPPEKPNPAKADIAWMRDRLAQIKERTA